MKAQQINKQRILINAGLALHAAGNTHGKGIALRAANKITKITADADKTVVSYDTYKALQRVATVC